MNNGFLTSYNFYVEPSNHQLVTMVWNTSEVLIFVNDVLLTQITDPQSTPVEPLQFSFYSTGWGIWDPHNWPYLQVRDFRLKALGGTTDGQYFPSNPVQHSTSFGDFLGEPDWDNPPQPPEPPDTGGETDDPPIIPTQTDTEISDNNPDETTQEDRDNGRRQVAGSHHGITLVLMVLVLGSIVRKRFKMI